MTERKYLPTFADLVDRLSIVILKQIFIPEYREDYMEERHLIEHDLDAVMGRKSESLDHVLCGEDVTAMLMIMLSNRTIWQNESEARKGKRSQNKLLRFTHSINGCRNKAKNVLSFHERQDHKIDCLAADLPPEFGNWNIWDE